ncbi:L-lactate MFS transporter [Jejuia pallidilutea]|jgi:OFA family oxalate/formate antiporter-like MFS transporter|uniref:Major facilitator:oxalate:formate antiporter n=3 Tax=Jejuia pallidilutea TaxID=504487 RepID=A0A090VPG9_9FLAO|nr:OFA family MFS transporter [Jejuia pallidilutea]GAL66635.1 major facilitator:oxalate:formate antiporter [Jejuia pallidilutea]GAL90919.1 major facilitator:oxalate:formate antiporter [Jejuia pallidilutea]
MKTQKLKNRWLIAASAVGIHISIGSVYAYSVMTNPVKDIFDVEGSVIKWAFKIAILLLGLSAAFLGRWVEKVGPKISGTTAGIFYGVGILGSGLAVQLESLWLFYLCYGVIGGIGLGLGYITPVSTLVKWFPDRRGLATGMAIMGFGFAALIFGPVMQSLFDSVGVSNAFYILGVIYMVLILSSARYIERPPEGYMPDGFKPGEGKTIKKDLANITANASLKTPRFYYIWIMMFINIACGIAIISAASPMMQEKLNYTPMEAAAIVGLIGVFNGLGRIMWSTLSDYLGRANTYIVFFAFQILAFYFLPQISMELAFLIVLFTVITMYGGGFATLPAFLGDLFGTKQLGAIHGMVLAAWGLAGVVGPTIYDMVKNATGSLDTTLKVFAGLFVIALIVALLMKRTVVKAHKENAKKIEEKLKFA